MLGLPAVASVSARTPATRDRSIDFLRLASLLIVVSGHGLMLLVVFDESGIQIDNVLARNAWLPALTWILQIVPLFFFAGAAASVLSYRRGTDPAAWLLGRVQRLYRPVFYYLAFWALVLLILRRVLAPGVYGPVAQLSIQLLWFLGIYVVVLAFVPLLARITSAKAVIAAGAGLYLAVAAVDVTRVSFGLAWLGFANFLLAWLIPAVLGAGYARRLVPRGCAAAAAVCFGVFDVLLVSLGPYELSLVTIPGQTLSNMTPPSLLLAGHAIVLCSLAIVLAPLIRTWMRAPRAWWFVAIGNTGAMTLYLWHVVALIATVGLSHLAGHDRSALNQPGFWWLVTAQLAVFYLLTAVLFLLLIRLENRKLPWWDARPGRLGTSLVGFAGASAGDAGGAGPGIRQVVVIALIVIAGVANLAAAKWGLAGPGLACIAVTLAALVGARAVAG